MNDHGARADGELRRAWAAANAADAAADTRAVRPPGPDDRDEKAGSAPGWATLSALLLAPVALLFGGLAPMATDGCGPDNCSQALDTALAGVMGGLYAMLAGTPALLLTAWLLPRRVRFSTARRIVAWSALLPPLFVILMVFTLPE
ncbi:hypothetical protein [Streptomyces albireticuli]|uniref:hypothetical protein n=1 Tax=Streptomyces albireticuli TaxID=1940 RepID=UPI001E5E27D4|nr:hypothetical protein [Streptomyces albireticuli]MCD9144937.1 hypothetical protein [Streptomyces albireticuli]MCD9164363.1 hypothetical protein [Streptomyces albireticuli]MCD9194074.1 hypothetical protein [Streptomyces albireticuli]